MDVKVKKLNAEAVIPQYANSTDAGLDLVATSREVHLVAGKDYVEYGTGLSIEIPEGYAGFLFPRSSVSNIDLILANSVGVIDSGYRGEIKLRFKCPANYEGVKYNHGKALALEDQHGVFYKQIYEVGDKIGQLVIMPIPKINLVEDESLSESQRGTGGFGSSGK